MDLGRLLKHVCYPDFLVRRAFPAPVLTRIEQAVAASERNHRAELRFVVEGGLDALPVLRGQTPRARALELFSALQVWDTEDNSGVLIYVQFVDHDIEILADRGLNANVPQAEWDAICAGMRDAFHDGRYEEGALQGIAAITEVLVRLYPGDSGAGVVGLSDRPLLL